MTGRVYLLGVYLDHGQDFFATSEFLLNEQITFLKDKANIDQLIAEIFFNLRDAVEEE